MKAAIRVLSMIVMFAFLLTAYVAAGDKEGSDIAAGLKEALQVGIKNAVEKTGVEDGFYKNMDIKILLPKKLKQVDDILQSIGAGELSEKLVEKMNRAAEKAAPAAKEIFIDAIKEIKFDDASKILFGESNEATEYLKNKTSDALQKEFYPLVKESMEEVKAIETYNNLVEKYQSNPLVEQFDLDINKYVTKEALNGLFKVVAEEEEKIRKDPAARGSDILKEIFGKMTE